MSYNEKEPSLLKATLIFLFWALIIAFVVWLKVDGFRQIRKMLPPTEAEMSRNRDRLNAAHRETLSRFPVQIDARGCPVGLSEFYPGAPLILCTAPQVNVE